MFTRHQHELAAVVIALVTHVLDGPALVRPPAPGGVDAPYPSNSGLAAARSDLDGRSLRPFLLEQFTAILLVETLERLIAEESSSWHAS